MLIYNIKSWHYYLILYVYGKNFFTEVTGIDIKAMESVNMEKEFKIMYLTKPRTVNFCPYWRAVIGAVVLFPFLWLWRLFPHPKVERTHKEILARSKRNSNIVKIIVASGMVIFAIWKLANADYFMAMFYFALAIFNVFSVQLLSCVARYLPKIKYKAKVSFSDVKKQRDTPKMVKKLQKFHEITCPPIFFIDVKDDSELK